MQLRQTKEVEWFFSVVVSISDEIPWPTFELGSSSHQCFSATRAAARALWCIKSEPWSLQLKRESLAVTLRKQSLYLLSLPNYITLCACQVLCYPLGSCMQLFFSAALVELANLFDGRLCCQSSPRLWQASGVGRFVVDIFILPSQQRRIGEFSVLLHGREALPACLIFLWTADSFIWVTEWFLQRDWRPRCGGIQWGS